MRNSYSNSYFDSISDDENGKSKNHVQHLRNSSFTIMDMLSFGQLSQAIYIVAKFRIADYLKNGPKSVEELAEQSKTHPDSLYRLLRMLSSVGIFTETVEKEDGEKVINNNNKRKFDMTPKAALLQSETKGSIRNFALMFGLESFNRAINDLSYSIETGENSFKHANGLDMFEYFQQDQNRKDAQIFNSAMASLTSSYASSISSMYDFSQFNTVVDIGGGQGILLSILLKNNPNLSGILFDLPHAIESAKNQHINESTNPRSEDSKDFLSRCKLVEGDFFKSIPLGADGYIIKNVILNWDDDSAATILKNCSQAMEKTKSKATTSTTTMTVNDASQDDDKQNKNNPKLLIIDLIMPEGNKPFIGKFIDIMLALTHKGRIRTEKEFHKLLNSSGFIITKIIHPSDNDNFLSIIEAIPGMKIVYRSSELPELQSPYLIQGLPGNGYVGKLAIDHLIPELNANHLVDIYSTSFSPQIVIRLNGVAELMKNTIFYSKASSSGKNDLLLLTGDSQPENPDSEYLLIEQILDIAANLHQPYFSESTSASLNSSNYLQNQGSNLVTITETQTKEPAKPPFIKRILLVDDDPDITLTFKAGINRYYYGGKKRSEIYAYTDPLLVVKEFKPHFYDLLLTDINMPSLNGFELCEKILELDVNIRICFMTAFVINIRALREVYMNISFGCFIEKPVSIEYLINRLSAELD